MKTKKQIKEKFNSILNEVDAFVENADEEKMLGRIVKLTQEVENGNADAMLQIIILGLYMGIEQ